MEREREGWRGRVVVGWREREREGWRGRVGGGGGERERGLEG